LDDDIHDYASSSNLTDRTNSTLSTSPPDDLNSRAVDVLLRVKDKLAGRDFNKEERLDVPSQVARLIADATSHRNLCEHYTGWCSFW
jgi:FKBP12-rapamycin complex-associated protein